MRPLASLLPGLVLTALLTLLATLAARIDLLQAAGASPLTLALLLGALLGNLRPQAAQGSRQAGLRFSQKVLLRTGVALYGFNLSLQQIAAVGSSGLWIDALIVVSTLGLGCYIGRRWLGMEQGAALLVAAGSAICGAAAIVATVSSLRLDEEARTRHTATAIATVVLFGTAAMLLYPLLFSWLGSDAGHFGGYVGSTVHEVAQVVAIGNALGPEAAQHAVIMKMIRVLMLVPFLLALGFWQSRARTALTGRRPLAIPWFALLFMLFAGVNSAVDLPPPLLDLLRQTGIVCLSFAMAAFGMETTVSLMRRAGLKPLLLGALLFVHLTVTGGWLNLAQ